VSVTAAQGFRASGVAAGIKASGAPDVALVVNDGPLQAVGAVYTSNRFQAAPVLWSQRATGDGVATAVVLNSGGANACTGAQGFQDTHRTAEHVGAALNASPGDVVVCSTGLIGELLPMDKLLAGVDEAVEALSVDGGENAAVAIKTTDSVHKQAAVTRDGFTVGGMAKGAGMLAPGLATMLVVITTDADVTSTQAQEVLAQATSLTFDRIDSDGCMSTNDTVILMASGASGVVPSPERFQLSVEEVCADLARQLIGDAEGASKDIRIDVTSAVTQNDAVQAARAISRSNLFKCAVHGEDPNWGRVLSAIGTTTAVFQPNEVSVAINGVWVCIDGSVGEDRDLVDMSGREVVVTVDLRAGSASATVWTNDLTADYVHENSAYST
jgi:glutamate N-acetyltransferase/amino-acid N-acetyltransferase